MIAWPHHRVALHATVLRRTLHLGVAKAAIAIRTGGRLAVIFAKLQGVIDGDGARDSVISRRRPRCDLRMAHAALFHAHAPRAATGILVTRSTALHRGHRELFAMIRTSDILMTSSARHRGPRGIALMALMREAQIANNELAPTREFKVARGVALRTSTHGRTFLNPGNRVVTPRTLRVLRQLRLCRASGSLMTIRATHMKASGAIHRGGIEMLRV